MKLRPTLPTSRLTLTVSAGFALALLLTVTLTIVGLKEMAAINVEMFRMASVDEFLSHRPENLGAPTQADGRSAKEWAATSIREAVSNCQQQIELSGRT